jgi:succinate dehydrogenase / fumarate reductase flavoprotein subunit
MLLDSKIPEGPLAEKWEKHKFNVKLVNPANKRKYDVIVVGTGLAGASAAASLAELGYNVKAFTYHDSPRRAHSIAAQGGINAAKNYQNDGDSVFRLFYDTIKGGDYRAREANVYRLAQVSVNIIDQCVAQGVPFAREYGGLLANRSFGGAQVSRTFYARGQTGQQLLLGAYSALSRQVAYGKVKLYTRSEMLDVVIVDGHARGIVTRHLITGEIETHAAHAVVLATGGYGNVFYLSTNAMYSNATAAWRAHKKGAYFANPCFTQIHPTCIPVSGDYQSKLTLMSESLRNDGRVWVPKTVEMAERVRQGQLKPQDIAEDDRDYFLERKYPAFGNLVPRDVGFAQRQADVRRRPGRGQQRLGRVPRLCRCYSAHGRGGSEPEVRQPLCHVRENHRRKPLRVAHAHLPRGALHYGGLVGRLQPSNHHSGPLCYGRVQLLRPRRQPPRGLGSDAGTSRRLLRDSLYHGDYLAQTAPKPVDANHPAFAEAKAFVQARTERLLSINGTRTPDDFHKALGHLSGSTAAWPATPRACSLAKEGHCQAPQGVLPDLKVVGIGGGAELRPWRTAGRVGRSSSSAS